MVFPLAFDSTKSALVAAEDPSVSGVSGRYATALFELARDEKSVDAVKADLDRFDAMLADSPDLLRLVRSPVFSAGAQTRAPGAGLHQARPSRPPPAFLQNVPAHHPPFAVGDRL